MGEGCMLVNVKEVMGSNAITKERNLKMLQEILMVTRAREILNHVDIIMHGIKPQKCNKRVVTCKSKILGLIFLVLFLLQKLHVIHSFLLITIEYSANPVVSLIGFSKDLSHHCISKQIIALEILSFTIML